MQGFKNILIVVDTDARSKALLERGAALAQKNQARLTVVDAIESLPDNLPGLAALTSPAQLQARVIEKKSQALEQLIAPLRQKGIQVEDKVLSGTPFLEIIREVLRNGHDLVMMMAEGEGGLKEWLFGSTTTHLLRKCPCPVWVMKRTQSGPYRSILAAVDPHPFNEERNALNRTIMDVAVSLAHLEQSEFHIVHTWRVIGEDMLRGLADNISEEGISQLGQAVKNEHWYLLNELLQQYDLDELDYRVHLLKGEAGQVIPILARAKGIDLIVMGTVSRTGVAGFIIGNTAENVLRQVDCAVLMVKPEGFVSPVKLDEEMMVA